MISTALTPHLTIGEILDSWPRTAAVFQSHRTACVGCAMARFDTPADTVRVYGLDLARFMDDLARAIADEEDYQ